MNALDRAGIAERLRQLIGAHSNGDLAATATRLGVEELSLRMSIDPDSPHPTIEVLAAVIGEFGLDPSWLLTGVCNSRTHRDSIENVDTTEAALRAHLSPNRPLAEPAPEPMRLLDLN